MKRSSRSDLAKETVAIVERGNYCTALGQYVDISTEVSDCLESTRFYPPEELNRLRKYALVEQITDRTTQIEVVNETTLSGVTRLLQCDKSPVAVLNFASAKNPGGGFLNGSQAQEESLARSSALYASQLRAWDFYERHRASSSLLYSNAMILSPDCPIFRDDDGNLLDEPQVATFITSAAPNAGAIANNRSEEASSIPTVFRKRIEFVLALAAAHGYRRIVLGAWGCGVFRNDPQMVATTFADHLLRGGWQNRFDHVVFSVLDTSKSQEIINSFEIALQNEV